MESSFALEYAPYHANMAATRLEALSEAKAVRMAHIRAEANIKAIGKLLMFNAVLGIFGTLVTACINPISLPVALVFSLPLFMAARIRALAPSGRWMFTIGVVITWALLAPGIPAAFQSLYGSDYIRAAGLLFFWGMIPSIFLYILWNRKGRMVMSEYYRDHVIPVTPHIEASSNALLLMVILCLAAAAPVVFAMLTHG